MKNFDIENLERKNIFATPDNFFEKMQEQVLKETVHKQLPEQKHAQKETKIFRLNWIYAAAAALALVFGLGYIFTSNNVKTTEKPAIAKAENNQKAQPVEEISYLSPAQPAASEINKKAVENDQKNLTLAQNNHPKKEVTKISANENRTAPRTLAAAPKAKTAVHTAAITAQVPNEAMMDEVLSSFTYAELKEASNNTEQDVYLDLYN